ncbi:pheromone A receptor-domain-containing protein [Ganoderma leucocontextum]|nr:pheromone A receptor-domain-containing protein [Ganoderma leucocontextum]
MASGLSPPTLRVVKCFLRLRTRPASLWSANHFSSQNCDGIDPLAMSEEPAERIQMAALCIICCVALEPTSDACQMWSTLNARLQPCNASSSTPGAFVRTYSTCTSTSSFTVCAVMAPYWIAQVDVPAALSLFGFALVTIPLFWHLQAWNIGWVLYIFWIGGLWLWRENAINFAPVWCDISIRFYIASSVGVVSSSLVITHRLHHIVNMTATATDFSQAQRRRNVITDLLIGLGIPFTA